MQKFDVVIIGASFSGLTLAHHLPQNLKVLVVDAKPQAGATVESTGLITEHTRQEFASFFDIDSFITNPITTIAVIAPTYRDYFFSHTSKPWIYQTDTKALIKNLADRVPKNVTVRTKTAFTDINGTDISERGVQEIHLLHGGTKETVQTKFLVGADGGHSKVASTISKLDQNKKFLFGYEQVFFGEVTLGPCPEETIYHFWFGEFSLGYGGWLSPTLVDGKKAFRVGLAKLMKDRGDAAKLLKKFLQILLDQKIIQLHSDIDKPDYVFGSHIPMGGYLKKISYKNILLIGDAAGFCGAFAADGIKGSVISGKEGAKVITRYLQGEQTALQDLKPLINRHHNLLHYYKKQVRYRFIWDLMKRDRTFMQMFKIIQAEKEKFLEQFCDSKEKRKSLTRTVFKLKHIPKLIIYSWFIFLDTLQSIFKKRLTSSKILNPKIYENPGH
jgi:flavin-dependent dehydrogenase